MLHRCFKGDKVVRPASRNYASSRCRDDLMVARPDFPNSFVGIFRAIQEQGAAVSIEDHRCSLKEAEPYGIMLTCPHGHCEVWEQRRKAGGRAAIAASEYEEWPRGRIVYDSESDRFILYADAQILRDRTLINAIHERFRFADRS
jgi:hypothetical protein